MSLGIGSKAVLVLLIVFLLTLSGVLILLKGFLLSRTVVDIKSNCETDFALSADDHPHRHDIKGCWMHGRFKKAVLVIIDALKYDFMAFNNSLKKDDTPFYKNKLKTIQTLMHTKPLNTRLYRFMADPPTTTMQRLKGMTTGSLPTFVDAGANFNSYEIKEDNIIDQMVSAGKRINFFGDDTWLSLYPNRFNKTFDFPSFDVQDLDTVDNGILRNILKQVQRSDWDVTIAHFLGVDHCGHRYGPGHPEMARKLSQMDDFLRNLTEKLDEDTILMVMGDHGMTRTGDHGGDSLDELEAGLFVYSPSQIASVYQKDFQHNIVQQTDLVPTVSLLLGLPVPFSSLGMVVSELFSHCPWWGTSVADIRQTYHRVKALRLNAHQIHEYLSAYQRVASDLPRDTLRRLRNALWEADNVLQGLLTKMVSSGTETGDSTQLHQLEDTYTRYIHTARATCQGVWAKFDLPLIMVGLLTITSGLCVGIYFFVAQTDDDTLVSTPGVFLLGSCVVHMLYSAIHFTLLPETTPPLMAVVFSMFLIFFSFILVKNCLVSKAKGYFFNYENVFSFNNSLLDYCVSCFQTELFHKPGTNVYHVLSFENVVGTVLMIAHCGAYFSNSFVVYEDSMSLFMLQTLIASLALSVIVRNNSKENIKADFFKISKKTKHSFDLLYFLTQPSSITFLVAAASCFLLRFTTLFWACREEQGDCQDSMFTIQLSSVAQSSKNQRYVFSVACLVCLVYSLRRWLEHYGNLNSSSPGTLALRYGPPLTSVFIALHWAVQAAPATLADNLSQAQQAGMAQAVYILLVLMLCALLAAPVLVYRLPSRAEASVPVSATSEAVIPTLYNQLKVRMTYQEDKPPTVYGLGSVYCASLVGLIAVISLLMSLLLEDGLTPALLLMCVTFSLSLDLYTAAGAARDTPPQPRWSGVVLLSLFSSVMFYSTAHQATIPSIRFRAAFTGFYGDFSNYALPGFLIWTNTFAGPIIVSLASPLLLLWPALSSALSSAMQKLRGDKKAWEGDFVLFNDAIVLRKNLFKVCCGIIVISTLKLLAAGCAAALHRRHLMVWKIFAPRLVYEAAMFLTMSICSMLAFLFVLHVDAHITKFVKSLPQRQKKQ